MMILTLRILTFLLYSNVKDTHINIIFNNNKLFGYKSL